MGRGYLRTISRVLDDSENEVKGVLDIAQSYFNFMNQGYFQGFQGLKSDLEKIVGIQVRETPLPDQILGAYLPQSANKKETIFINETLDDVFKLSTLAHEASHAGVNRYYQSIGEASSNSTLSFRLNNFQNNLSDKEELLADVVIAVGTSLIMILREFLINQKKKAASSGLTILRHTGISDTIIQMCLKTFFLKKGPF